MASFLLTERPYDIIDVIERIVDDSEFEQFKEDYGKTIVCGYGRVDWVGSRYCCQPEKDCKE